MLSLVPHRSKAQTRLTVLISCVLIVSNQFPIEALSIAGEGSAPGKPDRRAEPSITAADDGAPVEDDADEMDDAELLGLLAGDNRLAKRGQSPRDLFASAYNNYYTKRAPNPRDLFAAAYGDYYTKRSPNPRDLFSSAYKNYYTKRAPNPRDLFASAYGDNYNKRLNRNDPRSLFASVYGNYGKRAPSPRDLFSSVYGNYGYSKRYGNDGGYHIWDYGGRKRAGLKQNDPRSLFRSVYGYLK